MNTQGQPRRQLVTGSPGRRPWRGGLALLLVSLAASAWPNMATGQEPQDRPGGEEPSASTTAVLPADASPDEAGGRVTPGPTFGGRRWDEWRRLVTEDLDPATRFKGMLAVATLGRQSRPAETLKTLRQAIETETVPIVRSAGYLAVLSFGSEGLPTIRAGLDAEDPLERRIALYALADFFAPLQDPAARDEIRNLPTAADLPQQSEFPQRVTPLVADILLDDQWEREDRRTAVRTLEGLFAAQPAGAVADVILPAAKAVAEDARGELAHDSIRLIGTLGPFAAPLVPWLVDVARRPERPQAVAQAPDASGQVRGQLASRPMVAVQALGDLGAVAEPAIPALEQLQERDFGRQIYTAGLARRALARIRADLEADRDSASPR